VLVTHRESALDLADRIVRLRDGGLEVLEKRTRVAA
jgi:ABC-type sulfate/molybdate transport systems ATPase subunit